MNVWKSILKNPTKWMLLGVILCMLFLALTAPKGSLHAPHLAREHEMSPRELQTFDCEESTRPHVVVTTVENGVETTTCSYK